MGAIRLTRKVSPGQVSSLSQGVAATRYRYRDPNDAVEEMVRLHKQYAINIFLLTDDFPAMDRDRWEMFLDVLIESGLQVYLLIQAKAADIVRDRDILWKYRKAGVIHIYVGIESIDEDVFDPGSDDSGLPVGKLALDLIREHGIISEISFIIGGPDETQAKVEHTLSLARYYNPDNVQFLAFTPWPYEATFADVSPYIGEYDYSKYNLIEPIVTPKEMSLMQVDEALVNCYRRFYMGKIMEIITTKDSFKRNYLLKAMQLLMVSPFILKKLGIGTLGKLPAKIGEVIRKDMF
jgi:anaerobic magnesium-protoporphyrin IX monomethyl ester cyclase